MAGFSRNSRGGKRSFSSSSSSYPCAYYLTTAIFVLICVAGAWLFGSFSIFPSSASSSGESQSHVSRELSIAQSEKTAVMEDTQGELQEEITKVPVETETETVKDPEILVLQKNELPERKEEEVELEAMQAERQPREVQDEVTLEEREKPNQGSETGGAIGSHVYV